jgi:hypothetical protein
MSAATDTTPLPVRPTFREAVHTYHDHFLRVVGTAALVLIPIEILKGLARLLEEHTPGKTTSDIIAILGLTLLETVVANVSAAFYAGFMDKTVHAIRRGHEPAPIGHIARRLPYLRIMGVAVATGVIVTVGAVLFVVPGFIAYTLLAISGPIVVIENLGVWAAIKRSVSLTRHRFWRMALIVTIPALVEGAVLDIIARAVGHTIIAELLVHGVMAAFALAFVMLLEVHAAHWILEEAHGAEHPVSGSPPAPAGTP